MLLSCRVAHEKKKKKKYNLSPLASHLVRQQIQRVAASTRQQFGINIFLLMMGINKFYGKLSLETAEDSTFLLVI